MSKKKTYATSASNMDVPVGDRAGRLSDLGRQLAEYDAAETAFRKTHVVHIPTSVGKSMYTTVGMTMSAPESQKTFLGMIDQCRQQIEDEMAAILKKKR